MPSQSLEYEITIDADSPKLVVKIDARFHAPTAALGAAGALELLEPRARPFIRSVRIERDGRRVAPDSDWRFGVGTKYLHVTYDVALDEMALATEDLLVAKHAGEAVYAPWTSWLLRPVGTSDATPLTLRCASRDGSSIVLSGANDGHLTTDAMAMRHRVYALFGDVETRTFEISGNPSISSRSELTIARPRDTFALSIDEMAASFVETATLVGGLSRGFPARKVLVIVDPLAHDDRILSGRVQPSPFPAVCLQAGVGLGLTELRSDWVVVHEFIHLAFPPVKHESRWLDEGVATYFEPILRGRAGITSEEEVWSELTSGFRRGLHALEERGLAGSQKTDDVYWGGALFCLLADVDARQASSGRIGLEDGIHRLIERGCHVAGPIRTADELLLHLEAGTQSDGCRRLWRQHVTSSSPVDLNGLLDRLGVDVVEETIVLNDDAPWADIRRAILAGAPSLATDSPRVSIR